MSRFSLTDRVYCGHVDVPQILGRLAHASEVGRPVEDRRSCVRSRSRSSRGVWRKLKRLRLCSLRQRIHAHLVEGEDGVSSFRARELQARQTRLQSQHRLRRAEADLGASLSVGRHSRLAEQGEKVGDVREVQVALVLLGPGDGNNVV